MRRRRQDLVAELGAAMQAYQRSTDAFDDAVGRRLGVNPTDLRCLDWLVERAMPVGELGAATGLSSAATTTLVDRLVRKGFVRRHPDVADRRRTVVELTEEGRARIGACYGPMVEEGFTLVEGFTDEQVEQARDFLRAARELTDRHRVRVVGAPSSAHDASAGRQ